MGFSGVLGSHGQDGHATYTGKMPVVRFGQHVLAVVEKNERAGVFSHSLGEGNEDGHIGGDDPAKRGADVASCGVPRVYVRC